MAEAATLEWTFRSRDQASSIHEEKAWDAEKTAFIVCDMWDYHHSVNAVQRLAEFAPRLDAVLKEARKRGATIIHAPSDCMPFYEDHAARHRALAIPAAANAPEGIAEWCHRIPEEEQATYPIDQSDGGEDDDLHAHARWADYLKSNGRNPGTPWKRQTEMLAIDDTRDFIAAEGDVVWNVLENQEIERVVLVGVHTNMCVLGRPFGLRQMKRVGKEVVLMRDMTDVMYDPNDWPYVGHFTGIDLVIEHIERWVCPTVTSDQVIGGKPFRFRNDRRVTVGLYVPEREASSIIGNLRRDLRIHHMNYESLELDQADVFYVMGEPLESMEATGVPIIRLEQSLLTGDLIHAENSDHVILKGADRAAFKARLKKRMLPAKEFKKRMDSFKPRPALVDVRANGGLVISTTSTRIAFNSCFWATGQPVPETMPTTPLPADLRWVLGQEPVDQRWVLSEVPDGIAHFQTAPYVTWWRAHLLVPTTWKERPLRLDLACFGKGAEVYLNGELLESHYLKTEQLLFAQLNHLAIRVKGDPKALDEEVSAPALRHPNGNAISLSGRWQMRLGDDPAWKDFPIPPQFGASTDNIFEYGTNKSRLLPGNGPNGQRTQR